MTHIARMFIAGSLVATGVFVQEATPDIGTRHRRALQRMNATTHTRGSRGLDGGWLFVAVVVFALISAAAQLA